MADDDKPRFCETRCSQLGAYTTVLELAQVDTIDAGGFGVLIDLCKWTRSMGSQLKRVNVTRGMPEVIDGRGPGALSSSRRQQPRCRT